MATPSELGLARLAPGQKVILHYTPPPTELAGHDQLALDCASTKALARCDYELTPGFERQHLDNAESLPNVAKEVGLNCTAVTFSTSSQRGGFHHRASDTNHKFRTQNEQPGHTCKRGLRGSPKYTATILDATTQHDRAFKHACAVFIVPQGMELDWLVSTPEGQAQVVAGANAARVFLVTLNRGHTFATAEEVQKELSPWIRKLAPTVGLAPHLQPTAIPYTTTPQGIGHRTVLVETWSDINGLIVVEDVRLTEPGRPQPTTFRRMFFLDSFDLIQSEAVLLEDEPGENTERRAADTAQERCCKEEGNLRGALSERNTALNLYSASEEGKLGEESTVREHRKRRKRRAESLLGTSEGEEALRFGPAEKALGSEGFGGSSEVEQEHRKKERRREGESVRDSSLAAQPTGSNAEAAECGIGEFLDHLPIGLGKAQDGARGGLAGRTEADQRASATCLESTDGGKAFGSWDIRPERRAECAEATDTIPSETLQGSAEAQKEAVGELGTERANSEGPRGLTSVDFSYLASDYLQAMVAGLAFLGDGFEDRSESGALLHVLVIGLGGGAMPMFLRRHLPCRLEVIEIDSTVVQLAETYFGIVQDSDFKVNTADAVTWVTTAAATDEGASTSNNGTGGFDAVLIDVEAAGGQCPPPAFVDPTFLMSLCALLRPDGVFAMNVVATDETREAVFEAVRNSLGGRLYEWSVPRNSNRVLFSHLTSLSNPHEVHQTSTNGSHKASGSKALVMSSGVGDESCPRSKIDGDDVDLVYWASRLVEKGAKLGPWGRGPDLPQLAADIRPL